MNKKNADKLMKISQRMKKPYKNYTIAK